MITFPAGLNLYKQVYVDQIRPLFENAKAFYDHIVARSLADHYPSAFVNPCGCTASCRYRSDDGKKCVVGEVIPDKDYLPEMDDAGDSNELYSRYPSLRDYIPPGMTRGDMKLAQEAHDCTATDGIQADRTIVWNHNEFVWRLAEVPAFAAFAA